MPPPHCASQYRLQITRQGEATGVADSIRIGGSLQVLQSGLDQSRNSLDHGWRTCLASLYSARHGMCGMGRQAGKEGSDSMWAGGVMLNVNGCVDCQAIGRFPQQAELDPHDPLGLRPLPAWGKHCLGAFCLSSFRSQGLKQRTGKEGACAVGTCCHLTSWCCLIHPNTIPKAQAT